MKTCTHWAVVAIVLAAASGCHVIQAIDQWKCDHLGCCLNGTVPNRCGSCAPRGTCDPCEQGLVPGPTYGPAAPYAVPGPTYGAPGATYAVPGPTYGGPVITSPPVITNPPAGTTPPIVTQPY
jgi:hypothetical protein